MPLSTDQAQTLVTSLCLALALGACFSGEFAQGHEPPICGNGLIEGDEECDDSNLEAEDACTPACTLPVCGDGFVGPDEECDDGNTEANDACTPVCTSSVCGDGFVGADEACDDGNTLDDETCTADCQLPEYCGDGIVQPELGEVCDDGNEVETDTCTNACTASPEQPTLALGPAQVRRFEFSWPSVRGAEYYQLFERLDADQPFEDVLGNIPAEVAMGSLSLEVPLLRRLSASYELQACNGEGNCVASNTVEVTDAVLRGAIGYFKASNTNALDQFGWSVALSGDGNTLAVGARWESSNGDPLDNSRDNAGAVYVFARDGDQWIEQAYLKSMTNSADAEFGHALALSDDGNTLAVGAPHDDLHDPGFGAAYVFVRDEEGAWSDPTPPVPLQPFQNFGTSVALSGDASTLAIGSTADGGGVDVYERDQFSDNFWNPEAQLNPGPAEPEVTINGFGTAVALSAEGDTLVVGAPSKTYEEGAIVGVAYVFTREEGMGWPMQAQAELSPPVPTDGDQFGSSVSLSADGHTLAIGAGGSSASTGAVYLFVDEGQAWSAPVTLTASNAGEGDNFGGRVALCGDGHTLAIGARSEASSATGINGDEDDDDATEAGAVYVFTRDGDADWSQHAYVKAPNTNKGDWFGKGIALSTDGETLAVGAPKENYAATGVGSEPDAPAFDAGAAYLY